VLSTLNLHQGAKYPIEGFETTSGQKMMNLPARKLTVNSKAFFYDRHCKSAKEGLKGGHEKIRNFAGSYQGSI
jgi:hypothetical protein